MFIKLVTKIGLTKCFTFVYFRAVLKLIAKKQQILFARKIGFYAENFFTDLIRMIWINFFSNQIAMESRMPFLNKKSTKTPFFGRLINWPKNDPTTIFVAQPKKRFLSFVNLVRPRFLTIFGFYQTKFFSMILSRIRMLSSFEFWNISLKKKKWKFWKKKKIVLVKFEYRFYLKKYWKLKKI